LVTDLVPIDPVLLVLPLNIFHESLNSIDMRYLSQKYQQIIDYAQIQSETYIAIYSLQQLPIGIS
jgi:hypothetical protein